MTGDTLLETLQADVAAVLANCPDLAGVAVLTEDAGDMEKKILKKLGPLNAGSTGLRGLVGVVMLPEITEADINLPGPPVTVTVEIQMIEQPVVNRGEGGTGIRSSVAALRALASLQLRSFGNYALAAGRPPVAPVAGMRPGFLSHKVTLEARYMSVEPPLKPAGVGATWDAEADTLTLSCDTAGAEIYYTTDGSYPTPEAGTLYTAAIGPPAYGPITLGGTGALFAAGVPVDGVLLYAGETGQTHIWSTTGEQSPPPDPADFRIFTFKPPDAGGSELARHDGASVALFTDINEPSDPTGEMLWTATGGASGQPVANLSEPAPALPSGTVVRAVAYAAGMIPGDLTSITID